MALLIHWLAIILFIWNQFHFVFYICAFAAWKELPWKSAKITIIHLFAVIYLHFYLENVPLNKLIGSAFLILIDLESTFSYLVCCRYTRSSLDVQQFLKWLCFSINIRKKQTGWLSCMYPLVGIKLDVICCIMLWHNHQRFFYFYCQFFLMGTHLFTLGLRKKDWPKDLYTAL